MYRAKTNIRIQYPLERRAKYQNLVFLDICSSPKVLTINIDVYKPDNYISMYLRINHKSVKFLKFNKQKIKSESMYEIKPIYIDNLNTTDLSVESKRYIIY